MSIRAVTVGDVTIGGAQRSPAVVVPVLGATADELAARAAALVARDVDVVEWRVDHLAAVGDVTAVLDAARRVVAAVDGRPLLATVRTAAEGGAASLTDAEYGRLVRALAGSGDVDAVDVEHGRDPAVVGELLAAGRERGVPVLLSSHDFAGTPPAAEMLARLRTMQDAGADAVKLAVTPHDRADVLALLEVTSVMHERYARVPIVTMAMGSLGVVTRLVGHLFGSAATFAAAGHESAPGQPDLDDLRAVLDAVGRVAGQRDAVRDRHAGG